MIINEIIISIHYLMHAGVLFCFKIVYYKNVEKISAVCCAWQDWNYNLWVKHIFRKSYITTLIIIIIIKIIIAPLTIVSEDQWGDLECLYKACQAARTNGGLFRDTGEDERGENEWQSENDMRWKPLARSRGKITDKSWCKQD